MIADAARIETAARVTEPWLRRWLEIEADEFARGAIEAALAAMKPDTPPSPLAWEMPAHFVEAYSYVAERLCHRVRNTLSIPNAMIARLVRLARTTQDADIRSELTAILGQLQASFGRLARVVEFDVDGEHFTWKAYSLWDWLDQAGAILSARHGQATINVQGSPEARRCLVRANAFLLETAFGNLWANAVQAAEQASLPDCQITVNLRRSGSCIESLVRDNGPGFTAEQVEAAFRTPFSTKSETRGRGLLEIAEAVRRLQGSVHLVTVAPGEHRVLINLPMEDT
jgi:two-component system C4-dicarboxylate transport sensor histidine kinase DctB